MDLLKKYFTMGTIEWATTVNVCLKLGLVIGLFVGLVILLKIL